MECVARVHSIDRKPIWGENVFLVPRSFSLISLSNYTTYTQVWGGRERKKGEQRERGKNDLIDPHWLWRSVLISRLGCMAVKPWDSPVFAYKLWGCRLMLPHAFLTWILEIWTQMAVLADFYSINNHVQEKDLKCERIITQIGSFFSSPWLITNV